VQFKNCLHTKNSFVLRLQLHVVAVWVFYFKIFETSFYSIMHPEISRVTFQKASSHLTVTRGNGFISSSEFVKITDF